MRFILKLPKKIKLKWSDYLLLAVLLLLIITRLPAWLESYQLEGSMVSDFTVENLKGEKINPKQIVGKKILIFWASWCGPCKVELKRYHAAVRDGELKKESLWLIDLKEDATTVKKFLAQNKYQFNVYLDPYGLAAKELKVLATPTVIHLDEEGRIRRHSMGLSPLGIYKAKWFLNN